MADLEAEVMDLGTELPDLDRTQDLFGEIKEVTTEGERYMEEDNANDFLVKQLRTSPAKESERGKLEPSSKKGQHCSAASAKKDKSPLVDENNNTGETSDSATHEYENVRENSDPQNM